MPKPLPTEFREAEALQLIKPAVAAQAFSDPALAPGVDVALGHRTVDEAARVLDHHLDGLLSA